MKHILIILNFIVLILAILWTHSVPGYESLIVSLIAVATLIGFFVNNEKERKNKAKKEKNARREIDQSISTIKINMTGCFEKLKLIKQKEEISLLFILKIANNINVMAKIKEDYRGLYDEIDKIIENAKILQINSTL